jgi:3-oxoadipyl-CoA thiolase
MSEAYIIDGVRTPIGNLSGGLSQVRCDDLAAHVIKELTDRHPNLNKDLIEDVFLGCANQAGEDNRNIARMAVLLAGLPYSIPGETINRLCSSGMAAAVNAYRAIKNNEGDVYIAGGVEHMTRSPWVISKSSSAFGRDSQMFDSAFGWRFINPKMQQLYGTDGMGETAENLVDQYKISREDQDLFAFRSQQKATAALNNGRLAKEIVPVNIPQRKGEPVVFHRDEFIKPDTTLEKLGSLKPAFRKDGSVTAGNASGLNDGASAMLIASEKAVQQQNLKPLARIVSSATAGVEPRIMGIGPVPASLKALQRAGITLQQVDVIELNEAFAAQSLAVIRALGIDDNDSRLNPNGGAIALGHPLGMSGARIMHSAALELHLTGKKYALVTLCVGVGQGYAVVLEKA